MDALQHSRSRGRAAGYAPCAQARRTLVVRRTRAGTRPEGRAVAEPTDAGLEAHRRRLPSQSRGRVADRPRRLSTRSLGNRIHARPEAIDLHVRRQRAATMRTEGMITIKVWLGAVALGAAAAPLLASATLA